MDEYLHIHPYVKYESCRKQHQCFISIASVLDFSFFSLSFFFHFTKKSVIALNDLLWGFCPSDGRRRITGCQTASSLRHVNSVAAQRLSALAQ